MIVELGSAPVERVGGKAAGLARLVELGLPVPPAVVLPVGEELDDPLGVAQRLGEPLAVRSSAVAEDAAARSAAGQYETVLGVWAEGLAAAVVHVRGSTGRADAYGATGAVAVVIQREVPATRAGVAFSRDPVTGSGDVLVECAADGGEAVVSGAVTPDRYRVGETVRARAAGPLRVLRDDEARSVAELVRRAEQGFGCPVDVEFCFEARTLWLVQCRPVTTS
ncbi:MAG: PEP/pyruvate-binding domain-containing protein [Gaiellaceae bacterium]